MVIHSNATNRGLLLEILSDASYQVTAVANCEDGLQVVHKHNIDLILIDQHQQCDPTPTAYSEILKLTPLIPIIVLTSGLSEAVSTYYINTKPANSVKQTARQHSLIDSTMQALTTKH